MSRAWEPRWRRWSDDYDFVLIDCPPSLGLLTVNALAAADEVLIPIQCEYYALEGVSQLLRNIDLVRDNLNPKVSIGGVLLTMYDGRTNLSSDVASQVRTVLRRHDLCDRRPSLGPPF